MGTERSSCYFRGFNPRPHAEGDASCWYYFPLEAVSIHALTRRATKESEQLNAHSRFQSTPSRGGRHKRERFFIIGKQFQSTPSRGGRLRSLSVGFFSLLFQSTPSRGGRLNPMATNKSNLVFQSTPSRGGRRLNPLCRIGMG